MGGNHVVFKAIFKFRAPRPTQGVNGLKVPPVGKDPHHAHAGVGQRLKVGLYRRRVPVLPHIGSAFGVPIVYTDHKIHHNTLPPWLMLLPVL